MPFGCPSVKRGELFALVSTTLDPQAARSWYESHQAHADPTEGFPRQKSSKSSKKSKGRGGRKVGRAGKDLRLEGERLARHRLIGMYDLLLVHKDGSLDPWRTRVLARREEQLWDELSRRHLTLRDTSARAEESRHNHAYFEHVDARMAAVEQEALLTALNNGPAAARRLHAHRRELAILYQELELLTMSPTQSRAIGRDAAFVACGRRVKARDFSALFGWWSADQLLHKHGVQLDSEDFNASGPFSVASASTSEGDDSPPPESVNEADILALFAPDVEDDSDVDDWAET